MHVGWLHLCLLRLKVHLLGKTRNFGPKLSPPMVTVHYLPLGHLKVAPPGDPVISVESVVLCR